VEGGDSKMYMTKRFKALLIAVVVLGWGAIGTNVYLNFLRKPSKPQVVTLDLNTGQIHYKSR
jgi:hypothetical protein